MKKRIAKKKGVIKYPVTKKQLADAYIDLRKKVHELEDNYRDSKATAEYLASEFGRCKEEKEELSIDHSNSMKLIEEKDKFIKQQEDIINQERKESDLLRNKYKECSKLAYDLMQYNDDIESKRLDSVHKCDMLIEENNKLKQELEYESLPWYKKVFRR